MQRQQTKRQKRAEETKAAIIHAALKLFHDHGFDAVTIEQITTRAGVARGSFYTYFKSRSDIIVDQFWTIDDFYRSCAEDLRKYTTAQEKLLAFTEAQMRYVRDVVGIEQLKVLYSAQASDPGSDKMLINPRRYWFQLVTEIMQDGQRGGQIRNDIAAERLALWYNRTIRGLFLDWCVTTGEVFDLVREAREFCEFWILRSLTPTETDTSVD